MQHHLRTPIALFALCLVLGGCGMLDRFKDDDDGSPTAPGGTAVSLDVFAGTWTSATASAPATGCGT
jgi:hypothetical protein